VYNIHFKTEMSTIRAFKEGDNYDAKSSVIFSCTLHYISDTEAYICNAVGDGGRKVFRELVRELSNQGVTSLKYERNGVLKEMNLTRYK